MAELQVVLQLAIQAGFALLGIGAAVAWLRQPDRRHGSLALAVGSLAILPLLAGELGAGGVAGQVVTDLAALVFLASGYGLLMFRHSFVPFDTVTTRLVATAIALVAVVDVAVQLPASAGRPHSALQTLALVATLAAWALCVLEPIVTFWLAARRRPAVEKTRMRAISIGCAGLLAVVLVATLVGSAGQGYSLAVDLAALAVVPVLYVAFFPPAWVRRLWRQPDEDLYRLALHDLLVHSLDRPALAERALGWAERLVGGEAGFILDPNGSVLATRGITTRDAASMASVSDYLSVAGSHAHATKQTGSTVAVPLDLRQGRGAMILVAGPFTSMFGDDELTRLRQYAPSVSAALDRVALNSRIAALERAKSDFLNIASHELRGPMTVIKGYLTMLDAGALGELPPRAQSVLPLLTSKADEVNWMLEQMIEASRLEDGRLALKRRRTDIVELTDSAIDGVRMLLNDHELKVDAPGQAIEAEVDPDRFQIVVRNLLSNAAKYSPTGTGISVDVRRDGDKAFVSVTDGGVGISSDDQKRLFTRFGRIESSAHVQGTGLGLWLSREIARMHNGDLTVSSKPGQGSTFTLTVPIGH